MPTMRLIHERTALLLVDMQEKLLPHMHEADRVVAGCARLVDAAIALDLPILFTEQYRKGLGETVAPLATKLNAAVCRHEKLKFSACIEPIRDELREREIRSVIVCGIEAHVCVLQTCLDLLDLGWVTAMAVDAIGSRRASDKDVAVKRMTQAGVIPATTESAILELVREAGTDAFKAVLPIIK